MNLHFLLLIAVGTIGGSIFHFAHVPGGAMLGAVICTAAVKIIASFDAVPPDLFHLATQIGLGVVVGCMIDTHHLQQIKSALPVIMLSTLILLLAGFLAAWVAHRITGMVMVSAMLATSPGGLNAVVGLAADVGQWASIVLAFHLVRLYAVLLTAPLLIWLLRFVR